MNEEQADFAVKLLLIEQEARKLGEDLPPGIMRSRAENIVTTARLLRERWAVLETAIFPQGRRPK